LREQAQIPLLPTEREAFEQVIAQAKAALDENTFAREWATGQHSPMMKQLMRPFRVYDHAIAV
jgi:hypothetical protein